MARKDTMLINIKKSVVTDFVCFVIMMPMKPLLWNEPS